MILKHEAKEFVILHVSKDRSMCGYGSKDKDSEMDSKQHGKVEEIKV
jgi:hypothetical protein